MTKKPKPPIRKKSPAKKAVKAVGGAAKKTAVKKPVARKAAAGKTDHPVYDLIMAALKAEKADNVVSIDLAGKSAIADYMVIATGSSSRHTAAMARKLRDKLAMQGHKSRIEGADTGDWVILDARDVIVHFFRAEVRSFYNLEKLWSADFSTVDYTLYRSDKK